MFFDTIHHLIFPLLAVSLPLAYVVRGLPRWERIIHAAVRYHRDRLRTIMNEPGTGIETRDAAGLMLRIIDRQLSREMSAKGGFMRLPFRFRNTGKSTLASMDELFSKLYRDRFFGHESVYDERIDRLFNTLLSTISRWHLLHSLLAFPALAYMDFRVLLSVAGADRSGPSMLYRDIALGRFE
jgi:hypothetical protein